jgi:hypothetical protein
MVDVSGNVESLACGVSLGENTSRSPLLVLFKYGSGNGRLVEAINIA